jgi:membrane-bound ClpP family serine protease
MTPALCILLLFAAGGLLLAAEMFLPTHGILGVLGVAAILWGIGRSFLLNQWLGLGLLLATIACIPLVWTLALNIWPRTPIGRRMMLSAHESRVQPPPVGIGQAGVTVSGLRPAGICDFDGLRIEARTDMGTIDAGRSVRVVSIDQGRLIVRPIELTEEGTT